MSIDTSLDAAATITEADIFDAHLGGKLSVQSKMPLTTKRDLSIAYTPGVAQVSRAIAADPALAATHTWASRLVVVVSDGTAVLGLGNIGAAASLPVMEGKSALFKEFGGLDSIPLVLNTTNVDEIVETLVRLRPSFGAVNLEDVSAPRCFELEARLIEALDCPVMHDDQHGTAVVVLAALINAATVFAAITNRDGLIGGIREALDGADVVVGVSSSKFLEEDLAGMNDDAIIFALSNPDPEVMPDVARKYAAVVATGRSDFPNQINNVLAFPGIFRGALDAGARRITSEMKLAAAHAIAELAEEDLSSEFIVPSPLDPRVMPAVSAAVQAAVVAE
ncbi:NAD-dependent malic enzyme [Arthrobacter sp. UCD-GKA]|uniref:NAD(P)-dependent malic enzyme n=1 Tax=Arthrobacter sp. UCD-GKA TaxID=1913576 RepID=UPI0008DD8622|nr:malic enzyme-like NAD(P)-binding protein [Arthrobacter sp. UCD-GKA]OIH85038.1 NAD-dependent malic enzyme [Arthrobacter sp. UCD-GKA]